MKNRVQKIKQKLNTGNFTDTYYQERFLYALLLVGVISLLIQTAYFTNTGQLVDAAFNILIIISLWVAVWILHNKYYHLAASLTILSSLALLLFSVSTTGLSDSTIFWFFAFPVLATFLKGKHDGGIWIFSVVLILIALYLAGDQGLINTIAIEYDAGTFQQLIIAVFIVAILVYFYQDNLDRKVQSIANREQKLSSMQENLKEEIEHRKAVGESLEHNLRVVAYQKARTEALIQSIGEGVIAVDKDGKVIMVNKTTEELFNYYEEDILGKSYSDLFTLYNEDDEPIPKDNHPLIQSLKNKKNSHATDYFFHDYNNKPVPVATTASSVELDGENIGSIEVFRDITEEKAVAKAKDEFLSLASHQLRTPLGAIRWYSERLLKTSRMKEKNRKYLETIYEDSARMSSLLTDYLNVSRLELGAKEINVSENKLDDIIEKVLDDVKPLIKDKKLQVKRNYEKDICIKTDARLLEMIVQNLISNAVKYTEENDSVTISASPYSGNDSSLKPGTMINVEDTGIGIPEDEQRKIFTKLFRAYNAQHSSKEGTGLGLYSVKTATDKLNGIIWFESKPGKGTHFAVTLPDLKADTINEKEEEDE